MNSRSETLKKFEIWLKENEERLYKNALKALTDFEEKYHHAPNDKDLGVLISQYQSQLKDDLQSLRTFVPSVYFKEIRKKINEIIKNYMIKQRDQLRTQAPLRQLGNIGQIIHVSSLVLIVTAILGVLFSASFKSSVSVSELFILLSAPIVVGNGIQYFNNSRELAKFHDKVKKILSDIGDRLSLKNFTGRAELPEAQAYIQPLRTGATNDSTAALEETTQAASEEPSAGGTTWSTIARFPLSTAAQLQHHFFYREKNREQPATSVSSLVSNPPAQPLSPPDTLEDGRGNVYYAMERPGYYTRYNQRQIKENVSTHQQHPGLNNKIKSAIESRRMHKPKTHQIGVTEVAATEDFGTPFKLWLGGKGIGKVRPPVTEREPNEDEHNLSSDIQHVLEIGDISKHPKRKK